MKIKCEPISTTGYRFVFVLVCFCKALFLGILQKQTNDNELFGVIINISDAIVGLKFVKTDKGDEE